RRAAALALADALGVDAVAVLESDGKAPVVYQRRILEPQPAPSPEPVLAQPVQETERMSAATTTPFYKRAWFWAVVGGAAVASAGMVVLYYYSQPETVSYTCCR